MSQGVVLIGRACNEVREPTGNAMRKVLPQIGSELGVKSKSDVVR